MTRAGPAPAPDPDPAQARAGTVTRPGGAELPAPGRAGTPPAARQAGAERVPEDLSLPPADALALAQHLLDSGRPFHAHEVLEASWKQAPQPERELWRGLAQVAVGLTHVQRGNARGAVALLRRGADRVGGYAGTAPHGIDAAGVARAAAGLADRIEAAGDDAAVSSPPRISLTRS